MTLVGTRRLGTHTERSGTGWNVLYSSQLRWELCRFLEWRVESGWIRTHEGSKTIRGDTFCVLLFVNRKDLTDEHVEKVVASWTMVS
jgi:hypothetical protein